MGRFQNASKHGFSLIELAAVIAVISILAITAVPAFVGQDEAALSTAAQTMASDMRLTQLSAVWSGSARSVVLTGGTGVYVYDSVSGAGKTRDLAEIRRGIAVGAQSVVSFNSLGESGLDTVVVSLSLNGLSRTVAVSPFTAKTYVR